MSITRINNNISSLTAQKNVNKVGNQLSKSIERLSSGLRINRSADDAAGMSIAGRLKTQTEGLSVARTNAQDGINLINVAEGALEETTVRLNRIRQLALQAANTGVNDMGARSAIQDEVFQSIDEVTRIANTTQFASSYLLNGDFGIQSELKAGQKDLGISIDASTVASTLKNGTAFLNIKQTETSFAQIVGGDGTGANQILSTGILNQTDIAVTTGLFSDDDLFANPLTASQQLSTNTFFNGISISQQDSIIFEGVLGDGKTNFVGAFSVGATGSFADLKTAVQGAIDSAEVALFGVGTTADVPTSFRSTVTLGSGSNAGRLEMHGQGEFANQSSMDLTLIRGTYIATRSAGVTRSGAIGAQTGALDGQGQVGNSVLSVTGSTFKTGNFEIVIEDVQEATQQKLESNIVFRDENGSIINRSVSLGGSAAKALVMNGTFVNGLYENGTTLGDGDLVTLTGVNTDGSTFQGTFTFARSSAGVTEPDTALNDFKFGTVSGLIEEFNFRTRDFQGTSTVTDGTQTRFEDAVFTYTQAGVFQLVDDQGRTSETNFTLTFQRNPTDTSRANYTFADESTLIQDGYAEQASFSIDGGDVVRAEAGDIITLTGPIDTKAGSTQSEVTFRVGSNLSKGSDVLQNRAAEYEGALNGGESITFQSGDQDVTFVSKMKTTEAASFITIDFSGRVGVTGDGSAEDSGQTILISTVNQGMNFHIGANADQNVTFALGDLKADNLGFGRNSGRTVNDIDVRTLDGANEALRIVDEALTQVSKTRSIMGAATNRFEATIANLSVAHENLTASESRIRDADIAAETSDFTRNQVMLQAGVSVLAQANFQNQGFLALLS